MNVKQKNYSPYFTWGCADDLTHRLKKTLYCSDENDCYESTSAALTDVAVSMVLDVAKNPKRKLTQRYASSITRQLPVSPCALMMGILYSEKLRQMKPNYMERISSSDIFVVSMMVASKFLVDEGEDDEVLNDEWAEAAGLAVSTMNKLEREFLHAMDWNLFVSPTEFLEFCQRIETKIAYKYGLQRGWFSYTDLAQFLLAREYQKILQGIMESTVRIIGGCALLYGMSLSLIATSIMYASSPAASRHTTQSVGECSNHDMDTTMSYGQRCFTRSRTIGSHQNETSFSVERPIMTPDEGVTVLLDTVVPIVDQNYTQNFVPEKCDCQPFSSCFDAGFNLIRPSPVSAVEIVLSPRKSLCKLLPKNKFTACACDPGGGIAEEKSMATPTYDIIKFSRKKFYANEFFQNPRLFGMVVM